MIRSIAIFALLISMPVFAAAPVELVGSSEIVSMLISMLIVVGVIVLLGWLYSRSRLVVTGSPEVIQVVASRALGTKERLLVVEVADQHLLIGMTSTNVQTLHVFDKPIDLSPPESTPMANFSDRLKSSIRELRK